MAAPSCAFHPSSTTRPHGYHTLIRCMYVILLLSSLFRLGSGAESVSWLPPPAGSVPPTPSRIQLNASILVSPSSMPVVESIAQLHRIASIANVSAWSSPSLPSSSHEEQAYLCCPLIISSGCAAGLSLGKLRMGPGGMDTFRSACKRAASRSLH